MGVLADIYSGGNTLKRKLNALLADPVGEINTGVTRAREDYNKLTNLFANAYPMAGDRTVLNSPQQIAQFQREAADTGANMGLAAATVWHGSPHKFDKFDASKIGTGEGAQAYGHGLYLAESPEVATTYSNLRAAPNMEFHTASGRKLTGLEKSIADDMLSNGMASARIGAKANGPDWMDAFNRIKDENITRGNLYKVDLPDDQIAKMLDWDKPLSQQPKSVQDALGGIEGNFGEIPDFNLRKWMDADPLASTWHNVLQRDMGADPAMITKTLKDRGIPGIRYLDGGSRGAGQGSSNFVVFPGNESLLQILERNGQPVNQLQKLLK